jgi:hypothetical protein
MLVRNTKFGYLIIWENNPYVRVGSDEFARLKRKLVAGMVVFNLWRYFDK